MFYDFIIICICILCIPTLRKLRFWLFFLQPSLELNKYDCMRIYDEYHQGLKLSSPTYHVVVFVVRAIELISCFTIHPYHHLHLHSSGADMLCGDGATKATLQLPPSCGFVSVFLFQNTHAFVFL